MSGSEEQGVIHVTLPTGQVLHITHALHQAASPVCSQKETKCTNNLPLLSKARYAVCIAGLKDPFESEFLSVLLLVYISSSHPDPNITYLIAHKTENKVT